MCGLNHGVKEEVFKFLFITNALTLYFCFGSLYSSLDIADGIDIVLAIPLILYINMDVSKNIGFSFSLLDWFLL